MTPEREVIVVAAVAVTATLLVAIVAMVVGALL